MTQFESLGVTKHGDNQISWLMCRNTAKQLQNVGCRQYLPEPVMMSLQVEIITSMPVGQDACVTCFSQVSQVGSNNRKSCPLMWLLSTASCQEVVLAKGKGTIMHGQVALRSLLTTLNYLPLARLSQKMKCEHTGIMKNLPKKQGAL